ncbi:translation initiation factor IF-2 subunit alpha [Candidatus Woesearchaeota archaeon]|nr:translation initiation factor IF-2 subunit alpha [Candidatus Woesearchaeota archaeon]
MLYKKEGMPEENEIVLCTVTNVQHHSVFAKLDEYGKSGMIHISEVSPGRIRNLRDYVQEGKKVICKILRIDRVKGHIDLSLRRVSEGNRRKKNEAIKQEQKAEKIIETVAKKREKTLEELYEDVSSKVFEKYEYIFQCFNDIVEKDYDLKKLGIEAGLADELTAVVKEKIKPVEVSIRGILNISSQAPDGIEVVKKTLQRAITIGKNNVDISYAGAGKYNVVVKAPDYKTAEKILTSSTESAIKFAEKNEGEASFLRAD